MGHLARMQTLPFYPRKTSFLRFTVKSATSDKIDNHWPFLAFNSLLLRLTKIVLFKRETGDPGEKPPFGQHTVYGLLAVELSEEYHLVLLYLLITSIYDPSSLTWFSKKTQSRKPWTYSSLNTDIIAKSLKINIKSQVQNKSSSKLITLPGRTRFRSSLSHLNSMNHGLVTSSCKDSLNL